MRMPFGKHRGYELSELPDGYLKWLSTLELHDPLKRALDDEIHTRISRDAAQRAFGIMPSAPQVDRTTVEEIIGAGLRVLAKKYHPDLAGGSDEDMKRVNLAAAWLREIAANVLPEVAWNLVAEVEHWLAQSRPGTRE